jgi:hypothetical protein
LLAVDVASAEERHTSHHWRLGEEVEVEVKVGFALLLRQGETSGAGAHVQL